MQKDWIGKTKVIFYTSVSIEKTKQKKSKDKYLHANINRISLYYQQRLRKHSKRYNLQ